MCHRGARAFMLSLVKGLHGEPTPVAAANRFTKYGGVPGYGTPATRWRTGTRESSGVTLLAGSVSLHAVRLPDKTWAIDGGQRCS